MTLVPVRKLCVNIYADPPTVPKFPYFVPESRSIIRQYELSDFVTEIRKFWVYDIIDIPET